MSFRAWLGLFGFILKVCDNSSFARIRVPHRDIVSLDECSCRAFCCLRLAGFPEGFQCIYVKKLKVFLVELRRRVSFRVCGEI